MSKTRKTKEPVKASNVFQCQTCEGKPAFDGVPPIKEHLEKVHSLTEFKGSKKMLMHLDCADSYHSTYEWEIGPVKLIQSTTNPRQKGDLLYFGE